jgi:hypothetical protein
MKEQGMFDEMVSRLGDELKRLLELVAGGQVSAGALEHRLQGLLRATGREVAGVLFESADEVLRQKQKVHDRRTRTVMTLFGPVDMTRSRTVEGRYLLDEALGLEGRHGWTASVQEAVSLLACERGFETVCDLLKRLLDLPISAPAAQQIAELAGAKAAVVLETCPPPLPVAPQTLILAVDGCQAPERDGWHEVKVACVYAQEHRAKSASGRGKLTHKEYLATLEDAAAFGRQLWQTAGRWQAGEGARIVAMGDGAPWIWNLFALHFPGAIEIVDFYHAAEHLWATAEALYGERASSHATRTWARRYVHHLRHGRIDLVLLALDRVQTRLPEMSPERQLIVRRNREYFRTNQQPMRYALFKRWHLPIGTGAVEGSCKFLVQSRFKLPGCRWSHGGLAHMLALKRLRLDGYWDRLWPFRNAA